MLMQPTAKHSSPRVPHRHHRFMFPIPSQFLTPYLISNAVAFGLLLVAFRWAPVTRWVTVAIFASAALVNAWHATNDPQVYLEYAELALLPAYQDFILGWFSRHVQLLVYAIALGQAVIAALLSLGKPLRRVGIAGAALFLLAIAPLGVGSAFPFSLFLIAALIVMERAMEEAEWHHHLHIRTFTT